MTTSFDKETHSYFIDGKLATGVTSIIGVLAKPALIQWAANEAVKDVRGRSVRLTEMLKRVEPYKSQGASTEDYEKFLIITEGDLEEARTAHARKKEKAGTHGTDSHALVEKWINNCLKAKLEGVEGKPLFFGLSRETDEYYAPIAPFINWAIQNVDHFLFSERQMFNKELFIAGTADFGCVMKDGKRMIGDYKTSSGIYDISYFLQAAAYRLLAEAEGDEPYDGCVIVRQGKKDPNDFEVTYRYDYTTDKEAFLACLTLYRAQATYIKPNNN